MNRLIYNLFTLVVLDCCRVYLAVSGLSAFVLSLVSVLSGIRFLNDHQSVLCSGFLKDAKKSITYLANNRFAQIS